MTTTPSGYNSQTTPTETIEFPCAHCQRLLKVARTAIGMQAKCPQCQTVQTVRAPTSSATAGTAPGNSQGNFANPPHTMNPLRKQDTPNDFHVLDQNDTVDWVPPKSQSSADPVSSTSDTVDWILPSQDELSLQNPAQPTSVPQLPYSQAARATPPTEPLPSPKETFHGSTVTGRNTPTRQLFERITNEISKIFIGQDELVLGTLTALFSSGHILIESVPGLGKTLFVRTMGRVLGCNFGRIQFTADLMPSDITGAPIFDMKTQEFRFRPGPVFTQLLLGDEINRSPAKTHAALLEIMQEYRVTVDGQSHELERPFLVMATQNPIESEGTYNLPEAQLDRFMFKLVANYPREADEAKILELHSRQLDINDQLASDLETITSPQEILRVTLENANVRIDPRLLEYINRLVRLTREWPQFHMGASPRAGIAIMQAARTLAAFHGRDYAVPDDVVQIAIPALRHRVILTAEAEVEGQTVDQLLTNLIRSIEVPRL